MNTDQVEGRLEPVTGHIKEAAGTVVGNKKLEAEGRIDQVAGKTQSNYGDAKEKAADAVKKI